MTKTLLSTLLLLNTYAVLACNFETSLISKVVMKYDEEMDCNYVADLEDALIKTSALIMNAPNVKIVLVNEGSEANFDMGELLTMSMNYNLYDIIPREDNLSIFIHEYGHTIIQKRLEKDVKGLSYFFKKMGQYSDTRYYLMTSEDKDSLEYKKIEASYKRDYNRFSGSPVGMRYNNAQIHYQELFADLIAVLVTNDKDAIARAISKDNSSLEKTLRSFNPYFEDIYSQNFTSAHTVLTPTRVYIGENLWPNSITEKRALIEALYQAIVIEINYELNRSNPSRTIEQMNKSLIKNLNIFIRKVEDKA